MANITASEAAMIAADQSSDSNVTPAGRFGAFIVIATIVGVQFVDYTLFSIGDFDVSVQKLLCAAVLPVGLVLLGSVVLSFRLLTIGILFLASLAASEIFVAPNPALPGYLAAAALNIVAATILLTALLKEPGNVGVFCKVWLYFAVASAVITILQAVHVLPLFTVAEDQEYKRYASGILRGTGLKNDPNFQALMLTIGLVFTRFFTRSTMRLVFSIVLLAGVMSTLSRMGTIVSILVLIVTSGAARGRVLTRGSEKIEALILRVILASGAVAAAGYGVVLAMPQRIREFWGERMSDITDSLGALASGEISDMNSARESSGAAHAYQLKGSIQVLQENWLFGVGAGRMDEVLFQSGYMNTAAHNTYLEFMSIGGLLGIATLIYLIASVIDALRRPARQATGVSSVELSAARMTMITFALSCFIVTFIYNSVLWVLLTFCLAAAAVAKTRTEGGRSVGEPTPDLISS